jgi:hypothetical protein
MKNYIKLSLILLASFVITSCAALRYPDITKISIGMDKKEAIAAIRKNPDTIVGAKKYPGGGTVEVLQYTTGVAANGRPELSWLYFYNDKLIQFGRPDGEWQYNADMIAEAQGRAK